MKYIVYCTTNLVNNYIYIGVHKTVNPDIFDGYLGCGVYANKPYTYKQAKTCFQHAVNEFGPKNFRRQTLNIYDTAEEAYSVESVLVNETFLARPDVYNMILGGIINYVVGKRVYMYDFTTGNYIAEFESCGKAAAKINCCPATISNSILHNFRIHNYIFSFEKFNKLSLENYNFKISKPVYRYLKTGEFDKSYSSPGEAGRDFDTSTIYIQKAATLGYVVKDTYYYSYYKFESFDKAKSFQIKNRKVYKYDFDGNFVKEYESQLLAESENPNCNITKSIKLRTSDINNNFWSLVKVPIYNKPKHRISRKVAKLDSEGNILKIWNSGNECVKEVGVAVKNVLRGEYQNHKGFHYTYIDN